MLKLHFPILALLLGLFCGTPAVADPIDQIVLSEAQRQHSPAVAIAVVKGGQVLKAKGYGIANLEHGVKATAATFFQSASMGKQFTAALVMLLVRDGKLKLDEPISTYLSDAPATWRSITVRHLLTHTAGLDRTDSRIDLRKDYTEAELLASAYQVPLLSAPGEKHLYSNLGYQVLGVLCSRVGGKFYGEQMRDRLFAPLGMTSRVISERDIVPGRAAGYERYDGVLENQSWVAPSQNTTADGSLYVSALDMARWSVALDGQQLLRNEEKQAMWQPVTLSDGQTSNYGFGWKLAHAAGHRLLRHQGDWQGFTSHILHLPEDRLTITVLMNRRYAHASVIADRIAAHFIPALSKPPVLPPSAAVLSRTPMYVQGQTSEWREAVALREVLPGLLQAQVTLAKGMRQFRIGDANNRVADFGSRFDEALVKSNRPQPLQVQGEDLFLEVEDGGEHTFQVDLRGKNAPVLTILQPRKASP